MRALKDELKRTTEKIGMVVVGFVELPADNERLSTRFHHPIDDGGKSPSQDPDSCNNQGRVHAAGLADSVGSEAAIDRVKDYLGASNPHDSPGKTAFEASDKEKANQENRKKSLGVPKAEM
ncbi:Hypp6240 [Branchiostoma lanceolatum]|uniref:Hypp6240 protein n=1 Tax=Branchiostoma lanceolatum TaxID=7740 RepID=A0A8J9VK40_BRALA|nr:Hypp6240 [Branchiostoma lanceolatum]